jgi:hypothetical protein
MRLAVPENLRFSKLIMHLQRLTTLKGNLEKVLL